MTINIYLDRKSKREERGLYIYIRGIVRGKTMVFKTGEYITEKHWDSDKQKAKRSLANSMELNGRLDALKNGILSTYRNCLREHPDADYATIQSAIMAFKNPKVAEKKAEFLSAYKMFVERKSVHYARNSSNKHLTVIQHITNFSIAKKYKLSFDTIDSNFYEIFTTYMLVDKEVTNNTLSKYITALKTFMHWAEEHGFHANNGYKKFKPMDEQVDIVYLNEEELLRLLQYDFSDNPKLDRTRDIFCFQCLTGQRYSDICQLHTDSIKEGIWHLRTTKTKDVLKIPITKNAQSILDKYTGLQELPVISSQKMNTYIKEAAQQAGIDSPEEITRYRGSERITSKEPKYKFISTHTARRTFVTLSLEKGMRVDTIMRITGHKDYKTFKKYIKLTDKVTEQDMRRVWE